MSHGATKCLSIEAAYSMMMRNMEMCVDLEWNYWGRAMKCFVLPFQIVFSRFDAGSSSGLNQIKGRMVLSRSCLGRNTLVLRRHFVRNDLSCTIIPLTGQHLGVCLARISTVGSLAGPVERRETQKAASAAGT